MKQDRLWLWELCGVVAICFVAVSAILVIGFEQLTKNLRKSQGVA